MYKDRLLLLEPATGEVKTEFVVPPLEKVKTAEWGHIMVWDNVLVATVDPQFFDEGGTGKTGSWNATSSSILLASHEGLSGCIT